MSAAGEQPRAGGRGAGAAVALARIEVGVAAVLSLVALGLGARFAVSAGALWRDEVATLNIARRPTWPALFDALEFDSTPGLYHALLRLWMTPAWDEPDAAVRLFGFVVVASGVAALWAGARALGAGAPVLALGLCALHGSVVQTLSLIRPYGLTIVLGVVGFAAIGRMIRTPGATATMAAVAAAVVAVHVAYQNVPVVLAAAAVAFLLARDRAGRIAAFVVAGASLVALLPYAGVLARSLDWRPLTSWGASPGYVARTFLAEFAGGPLGAAVWGVAAALAAWAALRGAPTGGPPSPAVSSSAGRPESPERAAADRTTVYAALGAAAVLVAAVAFMVIARRAPHAWHWALPLGVVAAGLDRALASATALRWARVALAVVAAAVLLPGALDRTGERQTNVDDVARYVAKTAAPDDLVIVNAWHLGISFARYYDGRARWTTLPPLDDVTVYRYDLVKRLMVAPAPLADLHHAIARTLQAGRRVWLVGALDFPRDGATPPPLAPAPGLPSGWNVEPYIHGWSLQTGHLVQSSAVRAHLLTLPSAQPLRWSERVTLMVVEGWAPRGQPVR